MAVQLMFDEVKQCKTYLGWLQEKSGYAGTLSSILYELDFESTIPQDKIQMDKAKEMRKAYAEEVGSKIDSCGPEGSEASDKKHIDRLWKSIHNPCSLLEMMVYLARSLNSILNEDEEDKTPEFFHILLENSGLNAMDDEDYDLHPERTRRFWLNRIEILQKRLYSEDGKGGFFPLKYPREDQRKVSIWYQLNAWLEENSDEDGQFLWETERLSGAK